MHQITKIFVNVEIIIKVFLFINRLSHHYHISNRDRLFDQLIEYVIIGILETNQL